MEDKIFDIRGRMLKFDSKEDIEKHLKAIHEDLIEEFYLGDNTVGVEAAGALGALFSRTPQLKVAALPDIFGTRLISEVPDALTSICQGLVTVPALVELNLSNNALGGRAVHPLVPLIVENRSIQVFKLNNNGLGPEGGAVVAKALLESGKRALADGKESNLRVIICGKNRLEDGSADAWGAALAAHPHLQKVKMVNNGIREKGLIAIANGLLSCSDLRYLSLREGLAMEILDDMDPTVDDGRKHAWHVIADVLRNAKKLRFLDLSDCGLNIPGSREIIRALSANTSSRLRTLLLENNDMTEEVYVGLLNALQDNLSQLANLSLAWNEDLESDTVESITRELEAHGGRIWIDDDHEDDLDETGRDLEKEVEFIISPVAPAPKEEAKVAAKSTDNDVDVLADQLSKLVT
ncbi:RNI-like protein [Fistulina hepatica ATCC 64428]|nr:RNI-like protein [Fistulina hepatica ATCC 64428]